MRITRASAPEQVSVSLRRLPMRTSYVLVTCSSFVVGATLARAADPATELRKLAESMNPRTWAELKTEGLLEGHRAKGNSGAIFGYNEGAVWDPQSRQWLYVGGDHNDPARFVTYSADRNSWTVMPQPDWLGRTATHGYDHN